MPPNMVEPLSYLEDCHLIFIFLIIWLLGVSGNFPIATWQPNIGPHHLIVESSYRITCLPRVV
jgi:hypothetical protein